MGAPAGPPGKIGRGTAGNVVTACSEPAAAGPVLVALEVVFECATPTAEIDFGLPLPPALRLYTPTATKPTKATPATTYRKMRSKSFTRLITRRAPRRGGPGPVARPSNGRSWSARSPPFRHRTGRHRVCTLYTHLACLNRSTGEPWRGIQTA